MSDLDDELVQEFRVESQEHLATVEPALLQVEGATEDRRNELLHLIFRAVHSVKGASGFFELHSIQQLSHTMESLLMRVRDGELAFVPDMTDALLAGLDALGQMIEGLPDVVEIETDEIEARLASLTRTGSAGRAPDASEGEGDRSDDSERTNVDAGGPSDRGRDLGDSRPTESTEGMRSACACLTDEQIRDARRYGRRLYRIAKDADLDCLEDALGRFESVAEVLGEGADEAGPFFVVSSVLEPELLSGAADVPQARIDVVDPSASDASSADIEMSPDRAQLATEARHRAPAEDAAAAGSSTSASADDSESRESGAASSGARSLAPESVEPPGSVAGASSATKDRAAGSRRHESTETVRVSVHLLDRLMDQAGELVLSRNQLLRYFAESPDGSVKGILQDIDLITSELQGDIMNTRMQPIGGVFNKFTRIVRDLSRKLGKQVGLVLEGSEVELDKSIVELLSDPLTHLVRNSLDHGIESPAERRAAGKSEQGQVALRAFHEGGQVHIVIEDDGSGIDPDRMRAVAVSKGVVSQADADRLSDSDARMLIFAPGFSTADEVSDVSGRGVGMDVVKTNIGKLGGKVEIDSELGRGTRLTIALPLTLAIIPSLVVEIGGSRLAIPQVDLVELVRVKRSEIAKYVSSVGEAPVLRLRGNLLPLIELSELLEIESEPTPAAASEPSSSAIERSMSGADALTVVVVQVGGSSFGLTVDRVLDSEEIVVKPISSMLEGIPLYSGATIMGDGRVAMILDAHGIAEMAAIRLDEQSAGAETPRDPAAGVGSKRSLVLFNNASDEQFAIDLKRLIRLERISPDQLERVGDEVCIQYLGEGLPIVRLEDRLPVRPIPLDREELYVLIPKVEGRAIGVLAGEIVDAVETEVRLDERALDSPAIEGRALIGDRLTLVLDPDQLGREGHTGAVA